MTAKDILEAIKKAYPLAAIIPEVTIADESALAGIDGKWAGVPISRRIDALMFFSLQRTAIEIKVSRSDAARETWQKVRPWAHVTHRFIYAVPAGLLEYPPYYAAGLWWIYEDGRVEIKRKAKINSYPEPLPQSVVQLLAFRAAHSLRREDD